MDEDLSRQLADGATLIVDDRLAAIQIEAYLAPFTPNSDRLAWQTPTLRTRDAWAAELWNAEPGADRLVLSAAQSEALWRRIVTESALADTLIGTHQAARWAGEAWRLASEWQIDIRELRGRDDEPGFNAFLEWARDYRVRLAKSEWIDIAQLNAALAQRPNTIGRATGAFVWADTLWRTPGSEALIKALEGAGRPVTRWQPSTRRRLVHRVALEDSRAEIRHAVRWAQAKLEINPQARIALVIPPEADRDRQILRCLDGLSGDATSRHPVVSLEAEALDRDPAIIAAVDCLELFTRHAYFEIFSRWLRSPYIGGDIEDLATRSLIEVRWREELSAQLDFLTAFRSADLERWLARRTPQLAARLDECLRWLTDLPRFQSPTRWAHDAESLLTRLGWANGASPVPNAALDAWHTVLSEFARLTPIVGAIDFERMVKELKSTLARTRQPQAMPLSGIVLLSRPEQLGPGYDATWIAGMTDRAWPRPAQPNPLLPIKLQAVHAMPWATPGDALMRCRTITDRVVARVPEIVFSYPSTENEFVAEPSPLIAAFPALECPELAEKMGSYVPADAGQRLETVEDLPTPLAAREISGGAGTLELQARCPLRAFIESRLRARPIESVSRGLNPRQRGILTHRALELLYADRPTRQQLEALMGPALRDRIARAIRRSLNERVREAGRSFSVMFELEQERLALLLEAFVATDLERSEFTVAALETRQSIAISGVEVACRIDRIDRLGDRSLAIIDYKTGSRASPSDWFKQRLLQPQLPLYLLAVDEPVRAMVFAVINSAAVGYKGYWTDKGIFPGRFRPLPSGLDWAAQRQYWLAQLEALVAEYVYGDTRIFLDQDDAAKGSFAPLTRVFEHLTQANTDLYAGRSDE